MDRENDNRDQAGIGPSEGELDNQALDDAVGAYLLDALPEPERRAFEERLAASPDLRAEVARLAPVVRVLPLSLEENIPDVAPPASLRERILHAAFAEVPGPVPITEMHGEERDRAPSGTPVPLRPPGRVRPAGGIAPMRRFSPWALVAAALTLVAVGAVIWALSLQGRLEEMEEDLIAVRDQATTAALSDNAIAWTFTPTEEGPPTATGNLFYSSREQRVALAVEGLPRLPENQVYQLWYLSEGQPPQPAETFTVGPEGKAALIEQNVPPGSFQQVAITAEPEGGSPAPTGDILLVGTLSAAG
ncbi:MAG TPA: anti-sigma factor [Thermomicrobiales bacterium]|nr:anti-sigma factor [Thermomicrobiales bacterium]